MAVFVLGLAVSAHMLTPAAPRSLHGTAAEVCDRIANLCNNNHDSLVLHHGPQIGDIHQLPYDS